MSSYSATTRVVFEAQPEAQGNDAAPPLSEIFEQLAEVGKRVAKAMSLHVSDCIGDYTDAVVKQANEAMRLRISALKPVLLASLISSLRPLSAPRLLPNLEWNAALVLTPPSFRKPLPRRRGRPPGTEIVLRAEEIEEVHRSRARGLRRRPKRTEVAAELGVGDSTLYRRLRDMGLLWPPPWSD